MIVLTLAQIGDLLPNAPWFFVLVGLILLVASTPAVMLIRAWTRRRRVPGAVVLTVISYYILLISTCSASTLGLKRPSNFLEMMCLSLFLLACACPLAIVVVSKTSDRIENERSDQPCCRYCGYNLTLNVSGRCPECGKPIKVPVAQSAKKESTNTTGKPC